MIPRPLLAAPLCVVALTLAIPAARPSAQTRPALTIERMTSSAHPLAGTSPSSPVWAPDSHALAFLWNDAATPGRDAWLVERGGSAPRRLTRFVEGDGAAGGVTELAWAPTGRDLFVLQAGKVWRVPAGGGEPVPVVNAEGAKSDLAVSPDGRFVSYLQDGDLWLQKLGDDSPVRATRIGVPPRSAIGLGTYFKPDVEIGRGVWSGDTPAYAWSPDSRRIVVHVVDRRNVREVPFPYYLGDETTVSVLRRGYPGDENERRTLQLYDLTTGTLAPIDLPDPTSVQIADFRWSPSGRLLVDRQSDTAEDRMLHVVDPATRAVKDIWRDHRASRIYTSIASAWHGDGRRVLVVSDLDEWYRLYVVDPDAPFAPGSPAPRAMTSGAWDVTGDRSTATPIARPAAHAIFYVSTEASPYERHVYRIPDEGGPAVRVTTRPGIHDPFISPDGRTVATLHSDDLTPTELYLVDAAGGVPERRITRSAPPEFDTYVWAKPRYVTFRSRSGPNLLHARIIEPPTLDRPVRHPVLFGPVYSNTVRNRWNGLYGLLQQYLVSRGFIVVQVDSRGSTGYGRAFREQFLMDWGGGDLDDIESAVDYMKTLPYVDPDRFGIWGSSYGGTLTVFMLFRKPGLFKAGVAAAPATDPRFFGTDDVAIARTPQTHPEAFERGKASSYAAKLRDHLLIIHGMQDDVVPFKTTVALVEELMRLGKDFDVAFAPAATHGWTQREHYARYLFGKLVGHFERYLGGAGLQSGSGDARP